MTNLSIQVHNGTAEWNGQFHERTSVRAHNLKIPGAFQAASELPGGGSAWINWASTDMPRLVRDTMFRFEVTGKPNLLILRTDYDLAAAFKKLDMISGASLIDEPSLFLIEDAFRQDFRHRVVDQYDGIHIPYDFDRFSSAGLAYDCETTAWFRPGRFLNLIEKKAFDVEMSSQPAVAQASA